MKVTRSIFLWALIALVAVSANTAWGESQNSDYKGINDPFGDPSNYEFAEDEKEDKEFFHLGRFFMLGLDLGAGLYTGGLGESTDPGFYTGIRVIYFFDRQLAFEAGFHYASQTDVITAATGRLTLDTTLMPITGGFRFYFDTRDAPRALSLANPYLSLGAGAYLRNSTTTSNTPGFELDTPDPSNANFGAYAGAGMEFSIYRKHLYLGLDIKYHMIIFIDESSTLGNLLDAGARSGDYFTPCISFTYNF